LNLAEAPAAPSLGKWANDHGNELLLCRAITTAGVEFKERESGSIFTSLPRSLKHGTKLSYS
jgi:hypothetical protein